ncbi:putative Tip elongation aberrant protein 1 [Blattamonas nauphoetae]|uniref:Tip elongation aberrant protein 1 n=1 Tax=Blattamonas nauphoetae TaxID=2049346 RepID=A0ABQ9XNR3_9EUKA|nr:putative Tip elongation aberrant protein 1 [Blattamonas nauphoetae]
MLLSVIFPLHFVYCEIGKVTDAWDSFPKTGTPPSPRSKAVAINLNSVAGFEHNVLVFGGQNARGDILKDMFVFNTKLQKWSPFVVNGLTETPGAVDACTCLIDSTIYLWGGMGVNGFYNDMWKFDINTQIWSTVAQSGTIPAARQAAHFAYTADFLFICGGRTADGKTNDVHKYDVSKQKWYQVIEETKSAEENDNPPTRSNGGAYADDKYFYLFGGYTSKGDQSFGVYRIKHSTDSPTWEKVPYDTPTEPSPREGSGWCVNGKIVACYGGYLFSDGQTDYKNDAVFLDFTNAAADTDPSISYTKVDFPADTFLDEALETLEEWQDFNPNAVANRYQRFSCALTTTSSADSYFLFGGLTDTLVNGDAILITPNEEPTKFTLISAPIPNIPSPRSGHKSVIALGRMWIFGGRGGTNGQLLNDLYSFDVQTHTWEVHTNPASPSPPAREQYSIAEHSGRLIIFGGKGTNALTGEVSGQNDLWQYSINENRWEQISILGGTQPLGRYGSSMVCLHKTLFVYGGRFDNTQVSNELWAFSLVTRSWTKMTLEYSKQMATNHQLTYAQAKAYRLNSTSQFQTPSRSLLNHPRRFQTGRSSDKSTNDVYIPVGREECYIFTQAVGDNDYLIIGGGVAQSIASLLTLDKFLLPPESDPTATTVFYSDPPTLDLTKYDDLPLYYKAFTVPVHDGFVSFAGLEVDNAKARLNHWTVDDFSKITFVSDDDKKDKVDFHLPFISGGSAALCGRELFTFGGNIVGKKLPADGQFHNQMFRFELVKDTFSCSPGTHSTDPGRAPVGCSLCQTGSFNGKWNSSECTKCRAGSYNPSPGGIKGYHCVSCPNGFFNDAEGADVCGKCQEHQYCPAGSTSKTNQKPVLDLNMFQQPPRYQTKDHLSTMWMIIPYAGGVTVGAIVAFIFLCCPCTRHNLWRLDFFSSDHNDSLDDITHSSPKILRKTKLGGFVCIIFVCFVIGAIVSLVFEFFFNNITETKTLITGTMTTALDSHKIVTQSAEFSLTLLDFNGKCTATNILGEKGECQDISVTSHNLESKHGDKSLPLTATCLPLSSANSFRDPSVNCNVTLTAPNTEIRFDDTGSFPFIEFTVDSDSALCYGMTAQVKLDTGIDFGEKVRSDSLSAMALMQLDSEGRVFKGPESTDFGFTIMPSLYTDKKDKKHPGYFVAATHPKGGSKSLPDELFMQFGIKARINLTKDLNVVLTDRVMRQKIPAFLSNLMSTVGGFMGTFGMVVMVMEVIEAMSLPCCNRPKRRLFSVFKDEYMADEPLLMKRGEDQTVSLNTVPSYQGTI